ncbi:hypothetical protein HDV00_006076 [Rhizophlyctis rosea]|nr:hypothetical protein HDV00_006076 [Rhizophlyctis rosea]
MHLPSLLTLLTLPSLLLTAPAPTPAPQENWSAIATRKPKEVQQSDWPYLASISYPFRDRPISSNGFCGWQNGGTACPVLFDRAGEYAVAYCCSGLGYCGTGVDENGYDAWCDGGCQREFGQCNNPE